MYAMLLNPPRKKRRKSRRRAKLSKSCRRHIARVAARRGKKTRLRKKRRAARAARREAKKVAAQEKRDFWGVLPTKYAAANPRRKRRRRAKNYSHWIPAYAENPRRKRGRRHRKGKSRNYSHWLPAYRNPSWVPSYAMNPGVSGIAGMATQAFSTKNLTHAGSVALGAVANSTVNGFVSPYLPSVLRTGLGGVAFSLASAGVLSAVVGKVAPKFAGPVFFGGVFTAVHKIAKEYLLPALGLSGCCGDYSESMFTTPYMPDYAQTVGLNTVYPTDYDLSPMTNGMGDYLTRADAAGASPLGGHSIDGVATAELSS